MNLWIKFHVFGSLALSLLLSPPTWAASGFSMPAMPSLCASLSPENLARIRSRIAMIRVCHHKSESPSNITPAVQALLDQSTAIPKLKRRAAICIDCCGGPVRGAPIGASNEVKFAAYSKAVDYMLCSKNMPDQGIFDTFGVQASGAVHACAEAWLNHPGPSCLAVLQGGAEFSEPVNAATAIPQTSPGITNTGGAGSAN